MTRELKGGDKMSSTFDSNVFNTEGIHKDSGTSVDPNSSKDGTHLSTGNYFDSCGFKQDGTYGDKGQKIDPNDFNQNGTYHL